MAVTLELEPLVIAAEYDSGGVYAYPLGDPEAVARSTTMVGAVAEVEAYLRARLAKLPAHAIADYIFPADARLLHLAVVVPRGDLARRLRIETPITLPVLVVPDGKATWAHVLPLAHTVFVRPEQDVRERVIEEIGRVAGARELSGLDYLPLLPAADYELRRPGVDVERADVADLGSRAGERRRKARERADEKAHKLLRSIGVELKGGRSGDKPPVIGRDREIRTLAALLSGDDRLSIALVGPEMGGKSATIAGLVSQEVAKLLRPIIATSGAELVAGQSGFGQLEQRVDLVMRAAERVDTILYFDNFGDLFAGHSGGMEDIASIMRPYLAEGRVRVVGELTAEQLEHHEKHHVGFFGALHRITVEPLVAAQTLAVLKARVRHARRFEPDRPTLKEDAVEPLVDLAERYLRYQAFPGKAVRFYEELRAIHESDTADDGSPRAIAAYDVYRAFSTRSGIPLFLLRDEQAIKYSEIEGSFRQRVIGQHEAIRRVAQTLCMVKAGLQPPAKPLANFLFIGPTGVGKTEVAKTLARFLFGGVDRMVRFDMSEYTDPLAAERLIRGTQRDEGELTRKVRQQPFCVVLLDEIEKAHPAVFDLLLQVCGEGRLTDARGRTTWFHNAIIIMTSNLGARHRRPAAGFGGAEAGDAAASEQRHYLEQVDRHFRPEFVNRLDRVIPFRSLGREEIGQVARVTLQRVQEREGVLGRGLDLRISDAAVEALATGGYSDRYGARALRRHLEDALVAPLAAVLSGLGHVSEGASVRVKLDDEPEPQDEGWKTGAANAAQRVVPPLSIRVVPRPARRSRRAVTGLQGIARLRRLAARCLAQPAIVEIRERMDYLVADMVAASKTKRGRNAKKIGELSVEHARLVELLADVDGHVTTMTNAEDLAIVAIEDGESSEMMVEDATAAFGQFERAYVHAVIGAKPSNEIAFVARVVDDGRALKRWLVSFIAGAVAREWTVVGHRLEDSDSDTDWPRALVWGSPRSAKWCLEHLRECDDDRLAKDWRAVLLRVRGPLAGSLLRDEMVLWRYPPPPGGAKPIHAHLVRIQDKFAVSQSDMTTKAFVLPERYPPEQAPKATAGRAFARDGTLRVEPGGLMFPPDRGLDYWRDLERVHFAFHTSPAGRSES